MSKYLYLTLALILALANTTAWAGKTINTPPMVSLTAPLNGATYTSPANIILSATASDSNGSISKVEFYRGTVLIGTSLAAPYSVTWNNVPGGTYTLTAKATDNGRATTTSAPVTITVFNVAIATPVDGSIIYSGETYVSGTFTGDANTQVWIDSGITTRLGTLSGNTFSAYLPIALGENTINISVVRTDKTFDSGRVSIVGGGYPKIAFTSPAVTSFNAPANITLAADAVSPIGSITKVDFLQGSTLLSSLTSPPYQYAWNSVGKGEYSITAQATDNLGYTASISTPISVLGPNTLPNISLTSPANGATFTAPATITLTANATDSDGSISAVEFYQNGVLLSATNNPPYSLTLSNMALGSYTFTAQASDDRGGKTLSAPVTVSVIPPNNPPSVTLTSPASGTSFFAPATITLSANAADGDGSIAKVEFFQGATLIGTATNAPYTFNWTSVSAGTYSLTARATDNLGAATTSAAVSLTVNANSLPTISITNPEAGATFFAPATVALSATAADSDGTVNKVEFFHGTTLIGTATTAPYTFNWTNVAAGTYTLIAKATDNLGATATSAATALTVNAPSITVSTPLNGATLSGTSILVSGSVQAPANSGITINGIVASIDANNNFYANDVPLVAGSNILTATLTTPAGQISTQNITVNSDGLERDVQITADQLEVIYPQTVQFTLTNNGSASANIQINSGAPITLPAGTSYQTTFNFTAPGVYPATFAVTDAQGSFSRSFMMVVNDSAQVDLKFNALWSGMNNALLVADKATALTYLSIPAQEKYGPVFDALQADYQQIISTWSPPMRSSTSGDIGEYGVVTTNAGVRQLFLIYFVKGTDGVWRLDSM